MFNKITYSFLTQFDHVKGPVTYHKNQHIGSHTNQNPKSGVKHSNLTN